MKRRLWHDLLRTALGEVVEGDKFDDLFVRHTYLTMVVGNRGPGDVSGWM